MELAAEDGYDAVQMRDVAARAHVALGTIYRYFSSKDHLLAAGLVEWASELNRKLEQHSPKGDTSVEQLVDVIRRSTRALERENLLGSAMVTAITSPDPSVTECQQAVSDVMVSMLAKALQNEEESLRDGVIAVLLHVWYSSLLGWVNGWSQVGTAGQELENAARLLLRGV